MVLDQCIASTAHARRRRAAAMELHASLGAALARGARGLAAGAVRDRPGRVLPGSARASAARADRDRRLRRLRDRRARGRRDARAQREDISELTAQLLPARSPALPDGRRHAARPPRGRASRRRHVRLRAADARGRSRASRSPRTARVDLKRGVHKPPTRRSTRACACEACTALQSRSYLHHLVKCREPLGWQLLAFHNLRFYLELMREIRAQHRGRYVRGVSRARAADAGARRSMTIRRRGDRPRGRRSRPRAARSRVHRVGRGLREHPARRVGRDHALGQRARRRGAADLRRAIAARSRRRSAGDAPPSSCGTSGLGAAHNAMALRARARRRARPRAGHARQLRARSRCVSPRDAAPERVRASPARRAAPARDSAARIAPSALTWTLREGDFSTSSPAAPRARRDPVRPVLGEGRPRSGRSPRFARLFAHLARPAELFTYSSLDRGALVAARGRVSGRARSRIAPQVETDDRARASSRPTRFRRSRLLGERVARAARSLDREVRRRSRRRSELEADAADPRVHARSSAARSGRRSTASCSRNILRRIDSPTAHARRLARLLTWRPRAGGRARASSNVRSGAIMGGGWWRSRRRRRAGCPGDVFGSRRRGRRARARRSAMPGSERSESTCGHRPQHARATPPRRWPR